MQESVMQRMWESAHLSGGNAAYVEELYELYLHDPNAVPEEWRTYFQKLPADGSTATDVSHSTIRDHFVLLATVSYTHLTLPTTCTRCRSRWSPYH